MRCQVRLFGDFQAIEFQFSPIGRSLPFSSCGLQSVWRFLHFWCGLLHAINADKGQIGNLQRVCFAIWPSLCRVSSKVEVSMNTLRYIASWGLALFLIAMFLQATIHPLPNPPAGSVKFFDLPGENIVFSVLAEKSGHSLFEPTGRVFTGILELLTALLLLFPFTRRFGGFVSCVILIGAISLHMSPWLGRDIPLSLAAGETATDGGALFALAIAMLVASLMVIIVHPGRRR